MKIVRLNQGYRITVTDKEFQLLNSIITRSTDQSLIELAQEIERAKEPCSNNNL